jgi:hypothetical protein
MTKRKKPTRPKWHSLIRSGEDIYIDGYKLPELESSAIFFVLSGEKNSSSGCWITLPPYP